MCEEGGEGWQSQRHGRDVDHDDVYDDEDGDGDDAADDDGGENDDDDDDDDDNGDDGGGDDDEEEDDDDDGGGGDDTAPNLRVVGITPTRARTLISKYNQCFCCVRNCQPD